MKDRQMMVEVNMPITSKNHMFYSIVTSNGDVIANVFLHVSVKRNEFDETYSLMLHYSMKENPMYKPTEQEINSADFLFQNLVNVVQYDLSTSIDIDLDRINKILPINVKIEKIRKGEKICLKETC